MRHPYFLKDTDDSNVTAKSSQVWEPWTLLTSLSGKETEPYTGLAKAYREIIYTKYPALGRTPWECPVHDSDHRP